MHPMLRSIFFFTIRSFYDIEHTSQWNVFISNHALSGPKGVKVKHLAKMLIYTNLLHTIVTSHVFLPLQTQRFFFARFVCIFRHCSGQRLSIFSGNKGSVFSGCLFRGVFQVMLNGSGVLLHSNPSVDSFMTEEEVHCMSVHCTHYQSSKSGKYQKDFNKL